MRSSQAAVDLIVSSEVSSKATYIAKYQRPEWPGGASGLTVGIGYDLGYSTPAQIPADWKDYLTPDMIRAMQSFAGLTGQAAKAKLSAARALITIGWDAAMAVFIKHDMPKWENLVLSSVPGSENLPAGCFGVLTGLSYNRGASFSKEGDRYREMRNIRAQVKSGNYDDVPSELRSMKRLWPDMKGLRDRRELEAQLWEQSLKAAPVALVDEPSSRLSTGDERDPMPDVTPEVTAPLAVPPQVPVSLPSTGQVNEQPTHAVYSMETELIQRQLTSLGYYEIGEIDGKIGGKFVAGVAAFMTDRGKDPNKGKVTVDLKQEIEKALQEKLPNGQPWSRPISANRANATAKDLSTVVASVNLNWYQKLFAFLLGVPATVTAGLKGIFGDQNPPSGYVTAIKDFFAQIPSEFYWLAVAGLAVAIFVAAKKAQDSTVKDYQTGKIN